MKFALIALLASHGHVDAYKLDSGLTYDDCQAGIVSVLPADLPADLQTLLADAPRVCQLETE